MAKETKKSETEKVEDKKKEAKTSEANVEKSKTKTQEKKVEKKKTAKAPEEPKISMEREYVIPLREKCRVVPRYKKTNKAVKTVKEFLARHMRVKDRNLNNIKIDKFLNEYLWARGIRNPPHKVKVKVFKEGDLIKVTLADYPTKLKFKKDRLDKREVKALEALDKKKKSKPKEEKAEEKPSEEDSEKKKEEKEKATAGAEEMQKIEKAAAKQAKHQAGGKTKSSKRPQRKTLAK